MFVHKSVWLHHSNSEVPFDLSNFDKMRERERKRKIDRNWVIYCCIKVLCFNLCVLFNVLVLPRSGTASEVFVIWLATNKEKTVWDSRIVTSENEISLQIFKISFPLKLFPNFVLIEVLCVKIYIFSVADFCLKDFKFKGLHFNNWFLHSRKIKFSSSSKKWQWQVVILCGCKSFLVL